MSAPVLDGSFVPRARPTAALLGLGTETLLYDEASGSAVVLNPSAAVIWQCCDGTATLDELAGELAEAYRVELGTVRPALMETVREFARLGLLVGVIGEGEQEAAGAWVSVADPRSRSSETEPTERPRFLVDPPNA